MAIDQGEFGAGLYHLAEGAAQAEALDSHLSERIHWVGQTRDRIFGVSGLCHGVACDTHKRSVVFEVRLYPAGSGDDMREAWRIDPVAVLPGCPNAISIDGAERALLIATCHGLFRVDDSRRGPSRPGPPGSVRRISPRCAASTRPSSS